MFLTIDERKKFRRLLKDVKDLVERLEDALHKQLPIPGDITLRAQKMDISLEPGTMLDAFHEIQEDTRATYRTMLLGNAVRSYSCFCEYIEPDEPPAAHHELMVQYLEALERREILRWLLSMPPGHAKTTYGSHRFPAWYMGRNPTHRYLQSGHSQKFCELELGKIVKNIVDSDEYRDVFPHVRLSRSSMANDAWALDNNKGRYLTRAVDQGISGFRAHIACVDDPFASRADAESPTTRNKVYNWFKADLLNRLLPRAVLMGIMTRWHPDDLFGRLEKMMKEGGEHWEILNMPAFCEDEEKDPLGRRLGEPLWGEFYTVQELMTRKENMPPRDWNSLFRGRPTNDGGNVVNMDEMQRYTQLPRDLLDAQGNVIKRKIKRKTLSVDTASKPGERNDFTVCQVWIETVDEKHYLADVKRARVEFNDMVTMINKAATAWNVHAILVEDKGSGTQYIQYMKDKIAPAPIIPIAVGSQQSKEFRFDGVSPMFYSGQVLLPVNAPWLPEYEDEVESFPNGAHDDNVDATSQYLAWVRNKRKKLGSKKLKGTSTR